MEIILIRKQNSVYELITRSPFGAIEGIGDLCKADAAHIYGIAAFGLAEDAFLNRYARDGILFEKLRKIYLQQTNAHSSSVVLKAALNAFFRAERVWTTHPSGYARVTQSSLDDIFNLADVDEKRNGVRGSNLIIRAAAAHTSGQHHECARLLNEMTLRGSPDDPVIECHYGAFTYQPPVQNIFEDVAAHHFDHSNIYFHTLMNQDPKETILCAADPVYFKSFAYRLVESIERFERYSIHFHVINADDDCLMLFERMRVKFSHQALTMSSEIFPGATRAHFASIRYMRIVELLEFIQADTYVLDIDMSFTQSPTVLWSSFRENDCAFLRRSGYPAYLPWRSVGAGVALFKWSDAGRQSADLVSRCISYLWSRYVGDAETCWWIDQNALFLATEFLTAYQMTPGIIPASVVQQLNHKYTDKQRLLEQYATVDSYNL